MASAVSVRRVVVYLCGTVGVTAAGALFVRYFRSWLRRIVANNLEQKIEDAISNQALAELAKSSNVGLRQSAEQMLLDRITRRESFLYVLQACQSSDEQRALQACTALCVILKSVDQRTFHVDIYILQTLVSALQSSLDRLHHFQTHMPDVDFPERMQRMTLATIYDLSNDPAFLSKMEQLKGRDLVSVSLELLKTSKNKEVQRYSLLLLLQMTMQGKNCACQGAFSIIAEKGVSNHGDIMLQKICYQLLVTMINAQGADATAFVHEIAKQKILVPMVVSTKSDDVEVSFWSVALLHEFAVHNVYRKELCALPYLIKNLQTTLMASEAGVQRLILRVLAFLALRNDPFKTELLKNKALIGHLPTCLASGNRDVVYWALVLVHDLALMGRPALQDLLDGTSDELVKSLLSLASSRDRALLRLLADTLGLFCGCEQLHHRLVRAGSLEMILDLAHSHDADLVFWASALLLNLSMTSDAVKAEILSCGGLKTLIDLSLGDHENSQITTMAAKTLVMMAVLDEPIHLHSRCEKDSASVVIQKKTLQLPDVGINVILWQTLLDKELQGWHYSPTATDTLSDVVRVVSDISILQQQSKRTCECNMVIFTLNGEHAPLCLKALEGSLLFKHYSRSGLVTSDPLELGQGQSCCVVAVVDAEGRLDVMHIAKSQETVSVQLQVSGALVVEQRIRRLILLPLLHRVIGVPANSPINRVSDLELMEVLVRHKAQKDLVLECHAVMDQLTAMVSYFAEKGVDQLKSEPLAVAHSHGALRVLRVLAMYDHYRSELLVAYTVPAVVKLLNGLVNFWLNAILTSQQHQQGQGQGQVGSRPASQLGSRPVSRAGFRPGEAADVLRPQSRGMPGAVGLGEDPLVDLYPAGASLADIERNLAEAVSAISNTVQQLAAQSQTLPPTQLQTLQQTQQLARNRRLRSSSDSVATATTTTDSILAAEVEDSDDKSEEGQMTNHLSKFAVLTLAHLLNTHNEDLSRAVESSFHQSGALHALWATLLCSSEQLRSTLALPVSIVLTKLVATDRPLTPQVVKLDITTRTPALLVSTDHMEVRNDSWTFESIFCTKPLPRVNKEAQQPEGWYYEVELKSNGIIQVGWATKQCIFGPEKGVGVGDDVNSCAFDGARCRKWNGPITETLNNEYGLEWMMGDVVSCLMDRHGNCSFWLRGVNMGVAFEDVDLMTKDWYPACSVSTDQHIRFNFGQSPFRYGDVIPDGYIPFCQAHQPQVQQPRHVLSAQCKPQSGLEPLPQSGDSWQRDPVKGRLAKEMGFSDDINVELTDEQRAKIVGDFIQTQRNMVEGGEDATTSDFGYADMGGEAFAEMTDSPRHVAMAKIAEIDASLQRESFSRSGQRLGASVADYGMGGVGSGDRLQPMGMQGMGDAEGAGEAEEFHPPPSLYFEVNVSHVDQRPVVIGFASADATLQVHASLTEDGQLTMPDSTVEKVPSCPDLTIGCALLIPPGVAFYTVNGQPIRRLFNFLEEDAPLRPMTPCTNSPYLRLNFGQESFSYGPANEFDQRIYMAALLHDYCEQIANA